MGDFENISHRHLHRESPDFYPDSTEDDDLDESFDLDEILPHIGEFGRYQKLLLFGICLPACIPCGFCAFNQLFMTDSPDDYWCKVSALQNFTLTERKSFAIPLLKENDIEEYSKCTRYKVNWKEILENNSMIEPNASWPTESCLEGWEYNTTEVKSSIIIDFDLVCDRDIFPTLGLVALNIGGPIGVYVFGMISDRLGRTVSYFMCLGTLLLGSFITAASRNFFMWAFSRIIVGTTIPAVYQIPFIIALELVGPNYRSFVTVMTCTFYTMGLMLLSLITYFVRDWVELALYTSVPFLLYFLYIIIIPESPRWLLMKGKVEEALKILENMARINGKQLPMELRNKLQKQALRNRIRKPKPTVNIGAFDLCRTPNMRLKTILITLNWFANETVYLGLCYYGPALGDNQYLSFFLSSAVEVPAYICCWIMMDRWGRRWPMCLFMIFGGINCIITVTLPEEAVEETLILFLVSKTLISASFLIIYPFAGEIYPTEARGIGIGTSSYIGGLGMIFIPFITYLGRDNLRLPLVIMGCVAVIGGFTGLRLPETLNRKLPQTLEEGEQFGKDWTIKDLLRCVPEKPEEEITDSEQTLSAADGLSEKPSSSSEMGERFTERTPLDYRKRRNSMAKLIRQQSVMDTQKTSAGAMQLTYWF